MQQKNYFKIIVFALEIILIFLLTGCSFNNLDPQEELTVFAASSLTNAFNDLKNRFQQLNPGVKINLNFGSSSQLAAQIRQGVEGDIFASANEKQMKSVEMAGAIISPIFIFTTNSLAIVIPEDNPGNIISLEDLAQTNLRLVLAAKETPIRDYSDQFIGSYFSHTEQEQIYQNVVSEESNVRQVVTKVALGEADAGVVYSSDITPDVVSLISSIPIPPEFNLTAQYPIALLQKSNNKVLANQFVHFILSDEGQTILKNWGFIPMTEK